MNNLIKNSIIVCSHYIFVESIIYLEWSIVHYVQVQKYWISFFATWYLIRINFNYILIIIFIIIFIYYLDNIDNDFWFEVSWSWVLHSFWLMHIWFWIGLYLYYNLNTIRILKGQDKFIDIYILLMFIIIGFLWAYNIFSFMMWWFFIDNVELFILFIFYLSFYIYHKSSIYKFDKKKYLDEMYIIGMLVYGIISIWTGFHVNWNYYSSTLTIYSFLSYYFIYSTIFYLRKIIYKIQVYQWSNRNCQIYLLNLILAISMLKFAYLYIHMFNSIIINIYLVWNINIENTLKYILFIIIYIIIYSIDVSIYCIIGIFIISIDNYIYKHYLFIYIYWAFILMLNLQLNLYNYLLLIIWWIGLFIENNFICITKNKVKCK